MSGGSDDGLLGNRCVLGDLTNHYGKRALSSSHDKAATRKKVGSYNRTTEIGVQESLLGRETFAQLESSTKMNESVISSVFGFFEHVDDHKVGSLPLVHVPSVDLCDVKEAKDLLNHNFQLSSNEAAAHGSKGANGAKTSCSSFASMLNLSNKAYGSSPEFEEDQQEYSETDSGEFAIHGSQSERGHNRCFVLNECSAVRSKENTGDGGQHLAQDVSGISLECYKPSGSSNFRLSGKDGVLNLHGIFNCDHVTTVENIGQEKSCSCSFCLKAAYMWTDLHYQDARGRLAALKKSRRYARTSEGRYCNHEPTARFARDHSKQSTKLKFDLTQNWRSLFRHTEDVLVHEIAQLHSGLLRLKDLRENCKRNLQMISVVSMHKS